MGGSMQIYPTIEIKDGQCLGMKQGFSKQSNNYLASPVELARHWMNEGATFIHLLDSNGAKAGHSINSGVFKQIAYEIPVPLQLSGEIRNLQEIEYILNCGISRVVVGSAAIQNPGFAKEAIRIFSAKKVVIGIVVKDNRIVSPDGVYVSSYTPLDFCKKMEQMGVKTMIIREESGFLLSEELEIDLCRQVTNKTKMDVIVASDIYSSKDLEYINQANIHGALISRALIERWIGLKKAIKRFQ
jgi:phosphoribosylformimino-5-aminoimidazole carboxamide ribotide isomerase